METLPHHHHCHDHSCLYFPTHPLLCQSLHHHEHSQPTQFKVTSHSSSWWEVCHGLAIILISTPERAASAGGAITFLLRDCSSESSWSSWGQEGWLLSHVLTQGDCWLKVCPGNQMWWGALPPVFPYPVHPLSQSHTTHPSLQNKLGYLAPCTCHRPYEHEQLTYQQNTSIPCSA